MTSFRSILVHLNGSPRAQIRLRLARQLADEHGSALTALLAVAPAFADFPASYVAGPEAAMVVQQIDVDRRKRTRALFDQEARLPGPAMLWGELGLGPTLPGLVEHALLADLVVMGQHDPEDAQALGTPPDLVESVVIESGRPVLVVPYAGAVSQPFETVLIAWKPTREAAAAVTAALPFLRRAQQIHVMCALEELGVDAERRPPAPRLEDFLHRHGVQAPIEKHGGLRAEVGEALLSMASDVSADLLVMGCYGHTRLRELLLGGVTRTVLQSMTVPVLMAH